MEVKPVDPKLLARLKALHTDSVWGELDRRGYSNQFMAGLQVVRPDLKMVGRALTLRLVPQRPDVVQKYLGDKSRRLTAEIIELAQPGDILVWDMQGYTRCGGIGDQMIARLSARGGAGMVVDGTLRDLDILRTMNIPLYIKLAHAAPLRDYVGVDINVPVQCSGVTVVPGDILLGDTQGVMAIPPEVAEEVVAAAEELEDKESFFFRRILEGNITVQESHPASPALLAEYEEYKKRKKGS